MKFFLLMVKNLRRNLLRTVLTCLAIMVLVFMITMIWTVITSLNKATEQQAENFKIIITEEWQIPSQMPYKYAIDLDPKNPASPLRKFGIQPEDFMTWSFYGGSIDPDKKT